MANTPDRIDSKFRFVLVAAQRAEQLMRGARPRVEAPSAKPTRLAQKEVQQDLVAWDYGPPPGATAADEEKEVVEETAAEEEDVH